MSKSWLLKIAFLILAAALTACGESASTALPAEVSPTSPCPSSGVITISPTASQPADVLLEFAWEGGLTRPELAFAFGRVPEFSLLPDGRAYYLDPPAWDEAQVLAARLTPAETEALLQRVLDLGFERLESYTAECQPQAAGDCLCVMDAGSSLLRVRLPGGELREVRNYYTFANDPEALVAIRALLGEYRHLQAEPYSPDKAALFIRPVSPSPDLALLAWPLHPAWLAAGAPDASCVRTLSGTDLQTLLAVTERNLGDFYFRVAGADQLYNVYLTPWLPDVDYTDLIASSGQACASLLALDNTEWALTSLNGHSPVKGLTITLAFYPGSYMEGNAGCNSYGADYTTDGREFRVPLIHRTEQACGAADLMQQEADYFAALAGVAAYRAAEDRLEFEDAAGALVLVYSRQRPPSVDLALQDTEWTLLELRGRELVEGSRITLNLAQEGFEGYAGCNNYGGEYEQADAGDWATSSVWLTAMACAQPALTEQEQAFVAALGSATNYRLADERLELADASGEALLVFARKQEFAIQPGALLGTAWRLVSINAEGLIKGSTITLAFYDEDVLGGQVGCREHVATYEMNGDDLNLLYGAMFDAGCSMDGALLDQEADFLDILEPKADLRLDAGRLEVLGERGGALVFEPLPQEANLDLEGPTWSLLAFVGPNPFVEEPEPWPMPNGLLLGTTIDLTFEGDTARGSAGCNNYGAAYSRHDTALSFEAITITEMACLDPQGVMEQEQRYLDLLAAVAGYRVFGSQLWLETGDGRALIFTVVPSSSPF